MTARYAVIGNPVAHSLSPQIHTEFARQTGEDMTYGKLTAPLDAFAATARGFFSGGGQGLNVTLPFKHEAWRLVDAHAGGALGAQAVNTIKREGERLVGYNTDGKGLVTDLQQNLDVKITGKRVLLMGAGGATYGVMQPLLEQRPARLVIANRTPGKAVALAGHFQALAHYVSGGVAAGSYAELGQVPFDLVINATSAGLGGDMPQLPDTVFAAGAVAYDMVYGRETPFLAFARARGATCADGLGMLVEQAAESFCIWRGKRPQTAPVIVKLRSTM